MNYADLEQYPNDWLSLLNHADLMAESYPVITGRTEEDVQRVTQLNARGWEKLTDAERQEWLRTVVHGAYNMDDLNRVGYAVTDLADRIRAAGYAISVAPRRNWALEDIPQPAQMEQYLHDVAAVRMAVFTPPGTPDVPTDMELLTFSEANDIEQILVDVDAVLNLMPLAYFYSGEVYAGEV